MRAVRRPRNVASRMVEILHASSVAQRKAMAAKQMSVASLPSKTPSTYGLWGLVPILFFHDECEPTTGDVGGGAKLRAWHHEKPCKGAVSWRMPGQCGSRAGAHGGDWGAHARLGIESVEYVVGPRMTIRGGVNRCLNNFFQNRWHFPISHTHLKMLKWKQNN